ncbi:hypothetical protein [Fructilactobacillus ixorae]|nr:hypothetical protein [Fructilactobacillus ixorae]
MAIFKLAIEVVKFRVGKIHEGGKVIAKNGMFGNDHVCINPGSG